MSADEVYEDTHGRTHGTRDGSDPAPIDPLEDTSDDGQARRFVRLNSRRVLYAEDSARWHVFDGARWKQDDDGVVACARESVQQLQMQAEARTDQAREVRRARSAARIRGMIGLAKADRRIRVPDAELDAQEHLLTVANGTVDLRTGNLLPHDPADLMTKMSKVAFDQDVACPRWQTFLHEVQPSEEMRAYLQSLVGYSLTGSTSEECIGMCVGGGANGKTTFLEAIRWILGDYSMALPADSLLRLEQGSRGVPNDIAKLPGRRFVTISETDDGRKLDEARIKALASGDTISARFMRAEWFEFQPIAKFWLATNHEPAITGTDQGIWRRIRLLPWRVEIAPERMDKQLAGKLRAEAPGILAWAVRGAVAWYEAGLAEPEEVQEATARYRADQDAFGQFLDECCTRRDDLSVKASSLRTAYEKWRDENGGRELSQKAIAKRLERMGLTKERRSTGVYWSGLWLNGQEPVSE